MSETKAAAERLRRWRSGEEVRAAYSKADSWPAVLRDIDALLAEHLPDDDEPITEEWLDETWDSATVLTTMEYRFKNGTFEVGSINGCEFMNWKTVKTRGQLRRLLLALGDKV